MWINDWSDTTSTDTTSIGVIFLSSYICPKNIYSFAGDPWSKIEVEEFHDDISTPDYDNRSWTFKKLQEKEFYKILNKITIVIFNNTCYNTFFLKLMNNRSGYKGLKRLRKEGRI